MNLLFGKACPPLPLFNKVDGGRTYLRNNGQRIGRYSSTQCASNVNNLPLGEFVSRSIFAVQVNKPSAPLMSSVVCQCKPFKVFWSVVQFVSINVVYRKAFSKPRNKSQRNKPMHKHFWSFVAEFCRNNVVSSFGNPRTYLCLRPNALKYFDFPRSLTCCLRDNFWPKNFGVLANNPVDAFFVDGDSFHAVNYIAGHR